VQPWAAKPCHYFWKKVKTMKLAILPLYLLLSHAAGVSIAPGDFPVERAHRQEQLSDRAFLGVYVAEISPEKAQKLGLEHHYGIYVAGVIPNSGAERAGVRPFDFIYGIDQFRSGEKQSLGDILRRYRPGDEATLHLAREGRHITLRATLGAPPEVEHKTDWNKCVAPFLGVRYAAMNADLEGVNVAIVANSSAARMGMRDGDRIVEVNGFRILDWQDLNIAVNTLKVGEAVHIAFVRAGAQRAATGTVQSLCETRPEMTAHFPGPRGAASAGGVIDWYTVKIATAPPSAEEIQQWKKQFNIDLSGGGLNARNLRVEPNIAAGKVRLRVDIAERGDISVRLFNSAGRQIYNFLSADFSGEFVDEIDLAQNGYGDYFLEISRGNTRTTRKITLEKK
jgi:membrane-associated protease RseP (regulator of RpoE activity)